MIQIKIKWLHVISNFLVAVSVYWAFFTIILSFIFGGFNFFPSFIFLIIFGLMLLIWFFYFMFSYSRTNVENKYFGRSGLIVIFSSIVYWFFVQTYFRFNFWEFFPYSFTRDIVDPYIFPIGRILISLFLIVAFIIFLIGYYKNKRENPLKVLNVEDKYFKIFNLIVILFFISAIVLLFFLESSFYLIIIFSSIFFFLMGIAAIAFLIGCYKYWKRIHSKTIL